MDKLKRIHRDNEQLNFKEIWNTGIFIFDSNVLLDLYRLPKSAREDLINVLISDKFKDRIWIGFQVILEFLNNRFEAISDQKNKFHTVRTLIEETKHSYIELIENLNSELSKLKLKQRHSLIDPDKFLNPKNTENGIKFLNDFIENLVELEKKQIDVNDTDNLKNKVFEIFKGKIGQGFTNEKLIEIYKEGEKRYLHKFPPGYKDITKKGSHFYEDKEYVRKFGDLIFWKEIIEKAKKEKLKFVVLITGDIKEDWWFEKRGKKLGPRIELLNEIYSEVEGLDTFYMYDTSSFLQYAKNELDLNVKDSSIIDTKELIELSRQSRIENENGLIYIYDFLKQISKQFSNIRIVIGPSLKQIPILEFNNQAIYGAFVEIFSNVADHSPDRLVTIYTSFNEFTYSIKFRNSKFTGNQRTPIVMNKRGKGLEYIKSTFLKEGIDCLIEENDNMFWIELLIPKKQVFSTVMS